MRDRLAVWLCNLIMRTVATRRYRDTLDLHASIEAVLLDHADEIGDGPQVDANLSELAFVYERLTGWTVAEETAEDGERP